MKSNFFRFILVIGLIVGAVFGIKYLINFIDEKVEEVDGIVSNGGSSSSIENYTVGALTENGAPTASLNCFFTSEHIRASEYSVELNSDSNLNFQVFYYDLNKIFISSTEIYEESHSDKCPVKYGYIRVMFVTDVDYQLQGYNLYNYLNDFKITTSILGDTEEGNPFENETNIYEYYCNGTIAYQGSMAGIIEGEGSRISKGINITDTYGLVIKVPLEYTAEYEKIKIVGINKAGRMITYWLEEFEEVLYTDSDYKYILIPTATFEEYFGLTEDDYIYVYILTEDGNASAPEVYFA